MKKILYLLSFGLIVYSCGIKLKSDQTYKINIEAPIANGQKAVLYKIDKKLIYEAIDTVEVMDSLITFKIPKQTPDVGIVKILDTEKKIAFIYGDGDVIIKVKDNFNFNADVSSSSSLLTKKFFKYENDSNKDKQKGIKLMQDYRMATTDKARDSIKNIFSKWREKAKKLQYNFIKNNKDIVGLIVMQSLILSPEAEFGTIRKVFETYPKSVRLTGIGKFINTTILTLGTTKIGGKAPVFLAPTPEGTILSLNKAMGKVTLIDFWASWCRPCRAENPYVVQIYNKYHDRGFNIIGVALEKYKQSWLKAIEDDGLKWQHVSNIKFWQEPVAKMYGVTSIPQTFLLDAKGIIRAKNLRREKLEKKIVELLNE